MGNGAGFVRIEEPIENIVNRWQVWLLAAGLTAAPVLAVPASLPDSPQAQRDALITGALAGALLLIATLAFYFHWLTAPSRRHSWTVSAMAVMATQVLVSSVHYLTDPSDAPGSTAWTGTIDLLTGVVVVTLMMLGARAVRNPQPLLVGLGVGAGLAVLYVAGPVDAALATPHSLSTTVVLIAIVAGYLGVAWSVMRDHNLTAWARPELALTIVLLGIAEAAQSGAFGHGPGNLTTATAQVAATVLWCTTTFLLVRDALATEHRRSVMLEGSLLELEPSLRDNREQLHEIRSTVAGAASAARLLDNDAIGGAAHARLQRTIRTELDRLERLVSRSTPASRGPVDLDSTLDVLLVSHRAQGRTVEWEPSGGTAVLARPDDIIEALNILLDNAAVHGGNVSRVAVTAAVDSVEIAVSDEGPGVPFESREEIFEWGVHRSDSPGEGIGLSVARRLVSEHGGTLTLAEPTATRGTAFVIRLPAAQRSE